MDQGRRIRQEQVHVHRDRAQGRTGEFREAKARRFRYSILGENNVKLTFDKDDIVALVQKEAAEILIGGSVVKIIISDSAGPLPTATIAVEVTREAKDA